ncbi:PH-interacting protein isoform X2 [Sitophilus oryzae]|uniref:PH-interacting protein isoform X2 n=1 Tax=Sitophilus oryzae TaxID=7048 RepID=A0A6J2XLV0_SITOR|nr:PH-interacting protein isoform X2 [Sitophilus oryzae]
MDNINVNRNNTITSLNSRLNSDVYFLIQRFLSNGTLKRTLQTLNEELEEKKILPKRIDWEGHEYDRSVEDMENQYPYIGQDFLYYLSCQASKYLNPNCPDTSSLLSFRPKVRNKVGVYTNYKQFYNYVTRLHGAPIQELKSSFNIINSIRGREIAGPFSRHRAITPKLYNGIQNQRITLGHLSAVYCLLFDHSGRYIITGADDLLIKLWSTHTGRLIATFRGASSEITDIAIDSQNAFLAAGSIDRILRVWNLQTGAPIAVLSGHTGMITSVNFCPTDCWGLKYLISTSTDGSIAFWTYTSDSGGTIDFRNVPILYQEKIRPGQAQMICSSFSPGGTFLATGSADHNVRVYYMKGDEGPQRILETEAHTDRVDSIQWAHSGLKFLSGSKDGTAIIWWFEQQQWKNIHLDMTTKLSNDQKVVECDSKKIRVTMVAWDRSDLLVITAVSDHTLKVWNSLNGELLKVLPGHTDEVYVLEPHPHDNDVILSTGHDGQLLVWDLNKGEIVSKYLNAIQGQENGGIYDAKWDPEGSVIAASDSYGNILTFGFGSGNFHEQLPKELFFHTDYRPLGRDPNNWVIDEQTQVPPHLMPPPFLVDIDGNPYPPMLQRLVPGRENCNVDQLVPNIVIGNEEGTQEVIQDVPRRFLEDSEDEDVRGNAGGSYRSQRIRQSTGDWQTDHNIEWKKTVLIQPLLPSVLKRLNEVRKLTEDAEMKEYQKQLRQRPHMISTAGPSNLKAKLKDKKKRASGSKKPKTRRNYEPVTEELLERYDIVPLSDNATDDSSISDWEEEVSETRKRRTRRRKVYRKSSSDNDEDDDESSEDSDQTDEDEESSEEEKEERKTRNNKETTRNNKEKARKVSPKPSTSKNNNAAKVTVNKQTASVSSPTNGTTKGPKIKISEHYKLSEWLSETRPRKSPYYPQISDELVYFVQGHQLYVEAVKLKNIYEPLNKDLPWVKMQLKDREFCKVVDIHYEIKPPRLCCLNLAIQDEDGCFTGRSLTVKYHDMPDVLDFFVLKQCYLTALSRDWDVGDKFRCMIDDNWWIGVVKGKSAVNEAYPESIFMYYEICWTNGESERMSPWDMEPIDESRIPEDDKAAMPVSSSELKSILYKPVPEDWPNFERDSACRAITIGITQVMELAIAEPFLVPVDVNVYPSYARIIEYPIDLSTIKARFENNFYRRLSAAQFDIRYLAINAEKFNEKRSVIVKHAKIITELCLRILKSGDNGIDVASIYHQLVDGYDSFNAEDDIEIPQPSTSRASRSLLVRAWKSPDDWKLEAQTLLELMWQTDESGPFRTPVNKIKYPNYHKVIKNPMDLGTIKDKLVNNAYQVPQEFCADMKLMFQNSRTFNTNKRSRIYIMTVHLSSMFEDHVKKIMTSWRLCKKRQRHINSESEDSDISVGSHNSSFKNRNLKRKQKPVLFNASTNSDSDSDNTPLQTLRNMSRSNTATESDTTLDKVPFYTPMEDKNNSSGPELNGDHVEFEYLPGPSTSNRIEYFEHNYSSKRLEPNVRPNKNEKKNNSYVEKSEEDDEYKPTTFNKLRNKVFSDSDDPSESKGTNKKKEDISSSYVKLQRLELSPAGSETNDDSSELTNSRVNNDNQPSTSAQSNIENSPSEDSDELESDSKLKRNGARRKRRQSSDEDFCLEESSSNSRAKKTALSSRRRRKHSSELDEDFEINNRSFRSKKKTTRRKRRPSFVVEDSDQSSPEETSDSSSSSSKIRKRKAGLRQKLKRNKVNQSSESDNELLSRLASKRRKVLKSGSDDSDDDDIPLVQSNGKGYFAGVSSRGRIRKITERAAAFLKKDKKVG